MEELNTQEGFDERDITAARKSLKSEVFKGRFIRTDCNAADPQWKAAGGRTIIEDVRERLSRFRNELESSAYTQMYHGTFQKFDAKSIFTVVHHRLTEPYVPTARDLLHVYGADRDNVGDWERYYRYAWTDKGPNGIIFSTNPQIIREGKLSCNSYAYSGQNSYALAGAGILFRPLFGNSRISIRPYVQWLTAASFTGTESSPASATASLGIFVESWPAGGGEHYVEHDHWIPVWSQGTQNYITNTQAGGAASVNEGLSAEIVTLTNRKYSIYVYVYLETSANPQQHKNDQRFVTIDIDAKVPFVVVEETLI